MMYWWHILVGMMTLMSGAAMALPASFAATYALTARGIPSGTVTQTLSRDAEQYRYQFSLQPQGMMKLFVDPMRLESQLVLDSTTNTLRQLGFVLTDGDTTTTVVTDGATYDRQSVFVALAQTLAAVDPLTDRHYLVTEAGEAETEWRFAIDQPESIQLPIREAAVTARRARRISDGTSALSVWYADDYPGVPVRFELRDSGHLVTYALTTYKAITE